MPALENLLYYGDNLDVLRRYIKDETVDLVYLDPPFNSNANYNVLFAEQNGARAAAQVKVFEDTWEWNQESARAYQEVVEGGGQVSQAMQAFRMLLGDSNMLAYLSMMAPRLFELRRVMKPTASIYLHCDPTASHYLKLIMDAVFGPDQFRSEIIWRRTGTHGKAQRFGPVHDTILFYTKTAEFKWTFLKKPYMKGHVQEYFVRDEKGWRTNYYGNVLTGSGLRNGESGQPWHGFDPSAKNRHWAIPGTLLRDIEEDLTDLTQHQKLDRLLELGYVKIRDGEAWPIYEKYLKPEGGQAISDIWAFQPYTEGTVFNTEKGIDDDVRWLSPKDQERLGYPTQKPEGLLERIIKASSSKGEIVLDPFCGCGTAIAAAHRLNRHWIGIDVTHLAITLIKHRLRDTFDDRASYTVIGEPVSLPDAETLAQQDPYQFQWWALGLVGARPVEQKKGADKGIDGRLFFHDDAEGKTKQVILSVKAGHTTVPHVRDLRGVVEREKAQVGVLITMQEPTGPMKAEAVGGGFYNSPGWGKSYPRLQILTIAELLAGKGIDMPPLRQVSATFKKPPKAKAEETVTLPMSLGEPDAETSE